MGVLCRITKQHAPPVSALRRRLLQGMAALPAAAMLPRPSYAAAPATSGGQHHRPRGDRRYRHRRHPAFHHRHHGDQRNRVGRSREAGDRPDQRRPAASSAARSRSSRRTAPATGRPSPKRPRSCWSRTSAPRCSAAGPRPPARPCCRCSNNITACCTTRPSTKAWSSRRTSSTTARKRRSRSSPASNWVNSTKGAKTLLPDRFRLHLAAHLQQDRPPAHRAAPEGLQSRRRRLLPARLHPVQLGHQQDQAVQARRDLRDHRRRLQRRLLQAAQGGRRRSQQADPADHLGDRGRNPGHRRREHRRRVRLHEVLPESSTIPTTRRSSRPSRRCGATRASSAT